MTDETCPRCGADPDDVVEIGSWGGPTRRLPVFRCCVPDPTPAQLRRRAEDDWLAYHRELAGGGPVDTGWITLTEVRG